MKSYNENNLSRKLRTVGLIIGGSLILLVFILGVFFGTKMFITNNKINKGPSTKGVIINIWRSKCGSIYGNYSSFGYVVNNKKYEGISSCIVPEGTKVGDVFIVRYLKNNPIESRIYFEEKY